MNSTATIQIDGKYDIGMTFISIAIKRYEGNFSFQKFGAVMMKGRNKAAVQSKIDELIAESYGWDWVVTQIVPLAPEKTDEELREEDPFGDLYDTPDWVITREEAYPVHVVNDSTMVMVEEVIDYDENDQPVLDCKLVPLSEAAVYLAKDGIEARAETSDVIDTLQRELFITEADAIKAYAKASVMIERKSEADKLALDSHTAQYKLCLRLIRDYGMTATEAKRCSEVYAENNALPKFNVGDKVTVPHFRSIEPFTHLVLDVRAADGETPMILLNNAKGGGSTWIPSEWAELVPPKTKGRRRSK